MRPLICITQRGQDALATAGGTPALRDAHDGILQLPLQDSQLSHSTPPAPSVTLITPAGEMTHCPFLMDCDNKERNYF